MDCNHNPLKRWDILENRNVNYAPAAQQIRKQKNVPRRKVTDPLGKSRTARVPIPRLSFGGMTGKESISYRDLADFILSSSPESCILFPDTGFITTSVPDDFWRLVSTRFLGFNQMTVAELSGWLADPHRNKGVHEWLSRAIRQCSRMDLQDGHTTRAYSVKGLIGAELHDFRVGISDRPALSEFGYDYYVNLLSLRKRRGIAAYRELSASLSRLPTAAEMKAFVFRTVDQRSAQLAYKGWEDQRKPNFLADEELVVNSIISAILTGQESVVLTRDNDVFEQFAKMMELLVLDYSCFRFGEVLYYNPQGIPMQSFEIPAQVAPGEELFTGTDIQAILLPEDEVDRLPPDNPTYVNVFCFLIGNDICHPIVSASSFCLEMEMAEMLLAKGWNEGRNTRACYAL